MNVAQILGGLAHDLNNPLGAIRLHRELIESLLEDGASLTSEVRESLAIIDECVSRMQSTAANLRRYARGASNLESRETDLVPLVRDLLTRFERRIQDAGIEARLEAPSRIPSVRIDPSLVGEALGNLLSNSIDALSGAREKRVTLSIVPVRGGVGVIVRDTGPGVPAANAETIFEPFFTTRSSGKGLGLGLVIARSIARAHGGDVSLLGESGPGAAFQLWVPRQ